MIRSMRWLGHAARTSRYCTKCLPESFQGKGVIEDVGINEQIVLNRNFQKSSVRYEVDGADHVLGLLTRLFTLQ